MVDMRDDETVLDWACVWVEKLDVPMDSQKAAQRVPQKVEMKAVLWDDVLAELTVVWMAGQ